jgi:hypothetical protein
MGIKAEITGLILSIALVIFILELVRRRRLLEEYSLLWLFVGVVMVVLAFWKSGLDLVSRLIGIAYPPSTLFLFGLVFIIVLLLHFSTVISQLTEQNKTLAQKIAILEEKKQGEKT